MMDKRTCRNHTVVDVLVGTYSINSKYEEWANEQETEQNTESLLTRVRC